MICKLFFFENDSKDYQNFIPLIKNLAKSSRIITNTSKEFMKDLEDNKIKSNSLEELTTNEGSIANNLYREAEVVNEKILQVYENIEFDGLSVYKPFEYNTLIQLNFLMKIKNILLERKNTIFVFGKISPIFFTVMRFAKSIGYDCEIKIGEFKGKKIKYHSSTEGGLIKLLNETSKSKFKKFLKSSSYDQNYFRRFESILKITPHIFRYFIGKKNYQIKQSSYDELLNEIFKKVDKKIGNMTSKFQNSTSLFITAVRLDLFFEPLIPVINKFYDKNIPICIFTGDLSTGISLEKKNIHFINLFNEINILSNFLKKIQYGKDIKKKIRNRLNSIQELADYTDFFEDLFIKTFRAIAIFLILNHIFEKMQFKNVVGGGTGEMFENTAVELAKKFKIQSFSIVLSNPKPFPQFAKWFNAQKLFVSGNQGIEVLKKLGYEYKKMITVGSPRYDYCNEINSDRSKNNLKKNLGVDIEKKIILIAMSRWHKDDELWIEKLIKFCNFKNLEIIIKIHPTYKLKGHIDSENKINFIKRKCKDLKYFILYDTDMNSLLSASDFIITDWSSVGLEAILLEKPLIQVNFSKEQIQEYVRFYDFNASIYVEKYDELESVINDLAKGKEYNELKNGRQKVAEMFNFKNDGKAGQRIFENLTSE